MKFRVTVSLKFTGAWVQKTNRSKYHKVDQFNWLINVTLKIMTLVLALKVPNARKTFTILTTRTKIFKEVSVLKKTSVQSSNNQVWNQSSKKKSSANQAMKMQEQRVLRTSPNKSMKKTKSWSKRKLYLNHLLESRATLQLLTENMTTISQASIQMNTSQSQG